MTIEIMPSVTAATASALRKTNVFLGFPNRKKNNTTAYRLKYIVSTKMRSLAYINCRIMSGRTQSDQISSRGHALSATISELCDKSSGFLPRPAETA